MPKKKPDDAPFLVKGERIENSVGNGIYFTNRRIVVYHPGFWRSTIEDLGYEFVQGVDHTSKRNILAFSFGIFLVLAGAGLFYFHFFAIYIVMIGVLVISMSFGKKEYIEFEASSKTVRVRGTFEQAEECRSLIEKRK